ncbi:MAG: hypothetical protein R2848_07465 [Thermomicrobiales bacterium]
MIKRLGLAETDIVTTASGHAKPLAGACAFAVMLTWVKELPRCDRSGRRAGSGSAVGNSTAKR